MTHVFVFFLSYWVFWFTECFGPYMSHILTLGPGYLYSSGMDKRQKSVAPRRNNPKIVNKFPIHLFRSLHPSSDIQGSGTVLTSSATKASLLLVARTKLQADEAAVNSQQIRTICSWKTILVISRSSIVLKLSKPEPSVLERREKTKESKGCVPHVSKKACLVLQQCHLHNAGVHTAEQFT